MAAPRTDEILTLGIDLDAKMALQKTQKFQRAMKTELTNITKATQKLDKTSKKMLKQAVKGTSEWEDAIEDLTDATDKQERQLKALEERAKSANETELEGLNKQIQVLKQIAAGKKAAGAGGKGGGGGGGKGKGKGKGGGAGGGDSSKESFRDVAKDFKDSMRDAVGSFFSKDAKGLAENASKSFGKFLKLGHKGATAGVGAASGGLSKLGGGLMKGGAAKGGLVGGAMGAAGGGLKALGGVIGKMGPLLEMVGKLGPILSTVSTIMIAVVKVLIDAEAQAKGFQKELLASASTAEFLGDSANSSAVAFSNLEETVKGVRDAAFSLDNIKWGITSEETKAVISTLNQEGVTLRTLGQEAQKAGKSVEDFTGELVHSSVAYSRAFGVPLAEIQQMQAELFTDMGKNLQESRMSFAQITAAAGESGIATNKFFAMIRSVSADLSLYNNRLEDSVKTLKLLGKVMSPKNAQKFMQTAQQALRGMGRTDLLKTALLGGKGTSQAIERDLARKAKNIGEDIAKAGGSAGLTREDLLSKPVEELMQGVSKEQQGAIREAVADLRMDTKASKKGVFGKAMAMRNAGPAASLEIMKNSLNIGGTGKLADRMGDIGTQMMAENQGISQEQLAGMAKFEMAMDDERESLKKGLAKNDPKTLEKLTKAGLKSAEDIDKAGYDQIYDTMDSADKEMAKVDAGVQDMGKAQAKLTSSVLDKLGVLVDFIMNQIYGVLMDLYDGVLSVLDKFGIGEDIKKKKEEIYNAKALQQVKAGRGELAGAVNQADPNKALAGTKIAQSMGKVLDKAAKLRSEGGEDQIKKGLADIETMQQSKARGESIAGGSEWTKADDIKLKAAQDEVASKRKLLDTEADLLHQVAGTFDPKEFAEALKAGGASDEKVAAYNALAAEQPSLGTSGAAASLQMKGVLTSEDIDNAIKKVATTGGATTSRKALGLGKAADILTKSGDYQEDTAESTARTADKLDEKHSIVVKFSDQFLNTKFKKTMEEAVLDAARKALFEYYMYKDIDPGDLTKFMKTNNMSIGDMAKKMGEAGAGGQTGGDVVKGTGGDAPVTPAPGNAEGGLVTGVDGGLATVTAAAGEGLASIGTGERIMPRGGGGGGGGSLTIPINVNGVGGDDLAKIIHAKVIDGIAEYKRRERFT